jgi:hypothetical protein
MKVEEVLNEQHLVELFDSPVSYDFEPVRGGNRLFCDFEVEDQKYRVTFEKRSEKRYWDVEYGFHDSGEDRYVAKPKGDVPPRQAIIVLSTVVKIMDDFLRSQKPNMIWFTGTKDNKLASLYRGMIKSLKPALDKYDYSVEILDGHAIDDFIIMNNRWDRNTETLRETPINELFDKQVDVAQTKSGKKNVWEFTVGDNRYRITLATDSKYHYELDYGKLHGDNTVEFSPTNDQKQAFAVLGTVVNVIVEFLKTNKVASIGFKGNKGAKLGFIYQRMAEKLAPKLKTMGYTIQNYDAGMYEDFFIENNRFDFENDRFYTKKELQDES